MLRFTSVNPKLQQIEKQCGFYTSTLNRNYDKVWLFRNQIRLKILQHLKRALSADDLRHLPVGWPRELEPDPDSTLLGGHHSVETVEGGGARTVVS
jgi:hypothetical protein